MSCLQENQRCHCSEPCQVARKGTGFLSANDLKNMADEDEAKGDAWSSHRGVWSSHLLGFACGDVLFSL